MYKDIFGSLTNTDIEEIIKCLHDIREEMLSKLFNKATELMGKFLSPVLYDIFYSEIHTLFEDFEKKMLILKDNIFINEIPPKIK